MNKILFLDGYNLIHRARSGFKSGDYPIIFNFFRGIRPLIEKFSPNKVYFVLEGRPKFRQELSKGQYKSNRKSQDDSFYRQKAAIINLISECLPFTILKHPDLECDDVIATMSAIHSKQGDEVTIVSSDSDFIQLLNYFKSVKLYNPVKKKFIEKPPYDYVTWKALRGDATDNIKGIPGIGDKTADKIMASESLLIETLSDPTKKAIFEKNVNLIRLVDFSNDLSMLESKTCTRNFDSLKKAFENMHFDSMLKEKTWNKYVNTFKGI